MGATHANSGHTILATHSGFVELLVKLNDKVKVGQKVAIQRNTFGEIVAEYTSGVAGEVTARRADATAEPGIPLIAILYNNATHEFRWTTPSESAASMELMTNTSFDRRCREGGAPD